MTTERRRRRNRRTVARRGVRLAHRRRQRLPEGSARRTASSRSRPGSRRCIRPKGSTGDVLALKFAMYSSAQSVLRSADGRVCCVGWRRAPPPAPSSFISFSARTGPRRPPASMPPHRRARASAKPAGGSARRYRRRLQPNNLRATAHPDPPAGIDPPLGPKGRPDQVNGRARQSTNDPAGSFRYGGAIISTGGGIIPLRGATSSRELGAASQNRALLTWRRRATTGFSEVLPVNVTNAMSEEGGRAAAPGIYGYLWQGSGRRSYRPGVLLQLRGGHSRRGTGARRCSSPSSRAASATRASQH